MLAIILITVKINPGSLMFSKPETQVLEIKSWRWIFEKCPYSMVSSSWNFLKGVHFLLSFSDYKNIYIDIPLFHDFSRVYLHVSHTARLSPSDHFQTFSQTHLYFFLCLSLKTNPHSLQKSTSLSKLIQHITGPRFRTKNNSCIKNRTVREFGAKARRCVHSS